MQDKEDGKMLKVKKNEVSVSLNARECGWRNRKGVSTSKSCWEEKDDEDKELLFKYGSIQITENLN